MKLHKLLTAALFCLPLSALAETITFTATNPSLNLTGTIGTQPIGFSAGVGTAFDSPDATFNGVSHALTFEFLDPTATLLMNGHAFDFAILTGTGTLMAIGPKLYSGFEGSPTLIPGTYDLVSVIGETGTLVIAGDAPVGVTPEPSSLMLLGTGVLATIGAARRRVAHQ